MLLSNTLLFEPKMQGILFLRLGGGGWGGGAYKIDDDDMLCLCSMTAIVYIV